MSLCLSLPAEAPHRRPQLVPLQHVPGRDGQASPQPHHRHMHRAVHPERPGQWRAHTHAFNAAKTQRDFWEFWNFPCHIWDFNILNWVYKEFCRFTRNVPFHCNIIITMKLNSDWFPGRSWQHWFDDIQSALNLLSSPSDECNCHVVSKQDSNS